MKQFVMNNYIWKVITVPANSKYLLSRTGLTVGTTDPNTLCVYISEELTGEFKKRVIAHEMGHAACFSFHLIPQIGACCYPDRQIEMEEFICNFVANYGEMIFSITYRILGDSALLQVPYHLERMMA